MTMKLHHITFTNATQTGIEQEVTGSEEETNTYKQKNNLTMHCSQYQNLSFFKSTLG